MGLLTSDKPGKFNAITKPIVLYANLISAIAFTAGVLSFGLFISEQYSDRTYFSDNALLPGLVNREFTNGELAEQYHASLLRESKVNSEKIPYSWLTAQFRQMGLEVYTHNFSLTYPFGQKSGKNVYAILRAPRAPSTEAIVMSTPFRTPDSAHGSTLPGVALMLALAKYFTTKSYWAKDVIFLVGDHELVGIQAWLMSYHDVGRSLSTVLDYGTLEGVSGPIQAAVNLEIHGMKNSRFDLKIEGLNGQLPNLDLFNVVVELATRESITPTFHGHSHPYTGDQWESWKHYALTTGSMMVSQAITLPTGAHGLYQKFAIQALTIEAIEKSASVKNPIPITLLQLGRVIEGVFRSLNNLLEKFNRSYWFYLLPSTRRYLSIGYYMISFGLMAVPLVLKALQIYLSSLDRELKGASQLVTNAIPLLSTIPIVFASNLFGIALLSVPYLVEKYQHRAGLAMESHNLIYYTILTLSALFMFNPLVRVNSKNESSLKALHCVALLNVALLLSCVSLINISLALGLTLVYVPVLCILQNKSCVNKFALVNVFRKMSQTLLMIMLHPLAINYLCLFGLSIFYDNSSSILTHLTRAFEAQRKVLLYYIEDWYIYGNWTYFFGCAFLFPAWFQFWVVIF